MYFFEDYFFKGFLKQNCKNLRPDRLASNSTKTFKMYDKITLSGLSKFQHLHLLYLHISANYYYLYYIKSTLATLSTIIF